MPDHPDAGGARHLVVTGRVQGVGFRPFVFRLAQALGINGWVRNEAGQVIIHAEGPAAALDAFVGRLGSDAPPLARPRIETVQAVAAKGMRDFHIAASSAGDDAAGQLPPDLFCCDDCLAEMQDPGQRRYRYPFTNCTQCGPRYTIIAGLPYDRPATAMAGFALCPDCRAEYGDPADRRFHAQPLACPVCGPQVALERNGARLAAGAPALAATIALLRDGGIVAVKGIGGYHLMCDAADDGAVARLRQRKHRPGKPFAVMFPQAGADGLDQVRLHVDLQDAEALACADPVRPIVLAARRKDSALSAGLAPGLSELGVFLPYSPLHHLLLAGFGKPLVATSGNVSGEPVITSENEARDRLDGMADAFLHHDRPILRPADDSVVRVIAGEARPIRVGRGLAPLELTLAHPLAEPVLATGGQMKGAVALGFGKRIVVSPHIGELDTPRGMDVFAQVARDLQALHGATARRIACDAHPGYSPTRWAMRQQMPVSKIRHHVAHASALAGEHPAIDRWLTFTWDGVGLGEDNELWGGEAFLGRPGNWRRVASWRRFGLVGGDRAARQPWRSAAALTWEEGHEWAGAGDGVALAAQAWRKRIGTVTTSSAGRLFDAAAALVLGIGETSYEGEGPMLLESMALRGCPALDLPLAAGGDGILRSDWAPLLPMLGNAALAPAERAGIFHASLAGAIHAQATAIADRHPVTAIGLTGGVFQNRLLAEAAIERLAPLGLPVHLPTRVPAGDGGLAFGQIVETQALLQQDDAP